MASEHSGGRIIVGIKAALVEKLVSHVLAGPDIQTLAEAAAAVPELVPLRDLVATLPVAPADVAAEGRSTRALVKLETDLQGGERKLKRLVGFFALTLKNPNASAADVMGILDVLEKAPGVRTAYRELKRESPKMGKKPFPPDADEATPAFALRYLDRRPWGIGARADGGWVGGGSDVQFIDLEAGGVGWNLRHTYLRDMPKPGILSPHNAYEHNNPLSDPHGTSVLGVIFSSRHSVAPGVAPAATPRALLTDQEIGTSAAVIKAAGMLEPGDVLLIEIHAGGRPIELEDQVFGAIELAASKGIIVIEPAGNGFTPAGEDRDRGYNLDEIATDRRLAPSWVSHREPGGKAIPLSGAIIVGGCRPQIVRNARTHRRVPYSTFGSRVDCYAWAEGVAGLGEQDASMDDDEQDRWMSDVFSGTSSASAIIAGLTLLLQERAKKRRGKPVLADELRAAFLHDRAGTHIVGDPVRSMPEFASVVDILGIA